MDAVLVLMVKWGIHSCLCYAKSRARTAPGSCCRPIRRGIHPSQGLDLSLFEVPLYKTCAGVPRPQETVHTRNGVLLIKKQGISPHETGRFGGVDVLSIESKGGRPPCVSLRLRKTWREKAGVFAPTSQEVDAGSESEGGGGGDRGRKGGGSEGSKSVVAEHSKTK